MNEENILSKMELGNIPVFDEIQPDECCGCEVCTNACPINIISMEENVEGFYYPTIDKDKCLKCGICKRVCPIITEKKRNGSAKLEGYAGSSLNEKIINNSASGGMFSLVVDEWVKKIEGEYLISGVIYDADFRGVHHILSSKKEDILKMRTSKYVQSRKKDVYQKVKESLEKDVSVLFSGTPCEVAGLYSYLGARPKKLTTIDIICQGPTSPKVLTEYVVLIEKKNNSIIQQMNMRHKEGIWIPQYLYIQLKSGKIIKNLFYDTPIGAALHIMQRQSCYNCKFISAHKHSDITIGDYHGADKEAHYYNEKGTSIIIGNTEKGIQLIKEIQKREDVYIEKQSFEKIAETNIRLVGTWKPLPEREKFVKIFTKYGIEKADRLTRNKSIKEKIVRCLPVKFKQLILQKKQAKNNRVSM